MNSLRKKITGWWESNLRPRVIDLVGDYAGKELFMIEGDSLLRHAFSDKRIDMEDGFQLLHAAYVVERFLDNLNARKCSFHIIFFEDHKRLCVPVHVAQENIYKYTFARTALIRHLQQNGPDGADPAGGFIFQFKSMEDHDFRKYLLESRPYFAMCHDDSDIISMKRKAMQNVKAQSPLNNDEDDEEDILKGDDSEYEDEEEEDGEVAEIQFLLRVNIWNMMALGYNVAVVNQIEFVDSKIMAVFLEGLSSNKTNFPFPEPAEITLPSTDYFRTSLSTEREALAVASIASVLETSKEYYDIKMATNYLIHIAFLKHLSLSSRHLTFTSTQSAAYGEDTKSDAFFAKVVSKSELLLTNNLVDFSNLVCNAHDYLDGRLFKMVCVAPVTPPEPVAEDFHRLAIEVCRLSGVRLSLESFKDVPATTPLTEGSGSPSITSSQDMRILPFSNPVFDDHLRNIRLDVDIDTEFPETEYGNPFMEDTHWHNSSKPLVAPRNRGKPALVFTGKGQPEELKRLTRARKGEQFYLASMNRYAASLTGAQGGVLEPKTIIMDPRGSSAKEGENAKPGKKVDAKKTPGKGKKEAPENSKKKPQGKLTAAEIRANNLALKAEKDGKGQKQSWKSAWKDIAESHDVESGIIRIDQFLKKLKKNNGANSAEASIGHYLEAEIRLCKINLLQNLWAKSCRDGDKDKGYPIVALIFDETRKLLASKGLTQGIKQILTNLFQALEIAIPSVLSSNLPKREFSGAIKWNGKAEGDISIPMTSTEFQLLHCGPFMDRDMDSKPDDRVPFHPDGWQREVLDELDKNNSVFVVAPTSAGKTFIAFYAMEKVLRASDDGILVYVAPTKALVNQIAAEVIARFRKTYRHAGKTVWAIHTRDYRMNDPSECQILVTVPHVLQIMLLSPINANKWAPRVKRIIYDEVHCIGQAEDGVVWEQLLLLSPCPIIALSATVGNPEELGGWLKSTQSQLGIKLVTVQHQHRYSDLRKFIYVKKDDLNEFKGLGKISPFSQIEDSMGMRSVHPVASLVDTARGIPADLSLEPRDCLNLYWAMKACEKDKYTVPKELDYTKVFGVDGTVIKRMDVANWESRLKKILAAWMQDKNSPFVKVVQMLAPKRIKHLKMKEKSGREGENQKKGIEKKKEIKQQQKEKEREGIRQTNPEENPHKPLFKSVLPLLVSLHTANALPALLFSYDRGLCESLCAVIYDELSQAESKWRETDREWQSTFKSWKAYTELKNSRLGKKLAKASTKKGKLEEGESKDDRIREEGERVPSALESFDPEDPSPAFSFADMTKHTKAELQEDLRIISDGKTSGLLKDALKRGIGVHHSGLNRKYRQCVEMLFRKGYLRVVIATGTLSLGINMPCKTVVFAGDSIYLTALNFRQAAGRAGRRGFDDLGNVIFCEVPKEKTYRLISSKLPSLMGHFPITTTLVLRLFILLQNSNNSEHAKRSINSLLSQPRLYLGGASFQQQVLHHLRFSIEYLRRQKLLDSSGRPLNFAGLTSHLYYTENSSLAFHVLLRSDYLSGLCANVYRKPETTAMKIMLIMSHIFGRLPPAKWPAKPLPPLPAEAAKILKKHNDETLETYTAYVLTFAQQYCDYLDNNLPFTKTVCGGEGTGGAPWDTCSVEARSSFVALSGHQDNFESISDLTDSVRSGIFLEKAAVPYLDFDQDINGYLYEFYRHGEVETLVNCNGLRRGDVWFILKDFSLILATTVTSLEMIVRGSSDDPMDLLERMDNDSDDGSESTDDSSTGSSQDGKLNRLLKAFRLVRRNFDEKFHAMFA